MTLTSPDILTLTHLGDVDIRFSHMHVVATPLGTRAIAVVGGGTITGPGIQGEVLPGGGDWALLDNAGVARLDISVMFRTASGSVILATSPGRITFADDAVARLLGGETLRGDEFTGIVTPYFETGDDDVAWLNHTIAVGAMRELSQEHISYRLDRLVRTPTEANDPR
jgi:hypothetical protein